jgi:hypothetical protein
LNLFIEALMLCLCILGAIAVGAGVSHSDGPSCSSYQPVVMERASKNVGAKKYSISLPETEESVKLSTAELQRLVLLEQLKLARMQQQQINDSYRYATTTIVPSQHGSSALQCHSLLDDSFYNATVGVNSQYNSC